MIHQRVDSIVSLKIAGTQYMHWHIGHHYSRICSCWAILNDTKKYHSTFLDLFGHFVL